VASTGGITLANGSYLASIGMGGYAFAFSDAMDIPPGGSTACLDATMLCGKGSSVVENIENPSDPYGGGIGVDLNQTMGSTVLGTYTPTGSGITYALSNLPIGARIIIDSSGTDYCSVLTSTSDTVPWASFNTDCYGSAPPADTLEGPPVATHIDFVVPSTTAVVAWDFCVTALSFAP
jgi:hypothetical protein